MNEIIPIISIGFILGLKHAIEVDHLSAVGSLSVGSKSIAKSLKVGVVWGIGHTASLLVAGVLVLLFDLNISEKISIFLEMLVGMMLIVLGVGVLRRKSEIHAHTHDHKNSTHSHVHSHLHNNQHKNSKTLLIGAIHGLAGSGTLMLLVLTTINSFYQGMLYIIIFGLGSTLSMSLVSGLMSLSIRASVDRIKNFEKIVRNLSGVVNVGLGFYLMISLGSEYINTL